MPNKLQAYAEQAERTARQITGSHLAWTAFLTTAARLYKYPYNEQLMIYMQRPEATACAEYDFWNEKMGRYVRRGSTGIALIDATGYKPRLKYVFDVSDTGGKENARRVNLWELKDAHNQLRRYRDMLLEEYPGYTMSFAFLSPDGIAPLSADDQQCYQKYPPKRWMPSMKKKPNGSWMKRSHCNSSSPPSKTVSSKESKPKPDSTIYTPSWTD